MKKERALSIIAVVMTVAFFFSMLWGYSQQRLNQQLYAYLENEYQRAYYDYLADLKAVAATAGKVQSASALQRAVLLGELSAQAASAGDNLTTLPIQQARYQQSAAYLNQIADYATSLAVQLARGKELEQKDTKNLTAIYEKLQEIHGQMEEMETEVAEGSIRFADVHRDGSWWQTVRRTIGGARSVQGAAAAIDEQSADGFFMRANALLDGLEPLEYQGRHSSHMDNLPARGLEGSKQVSAEEAADIATKFLEIMGVTGLKHNGGEEIEAEGTIPLYSLLFEQGEGGVAQDTHIYVTVSQMGGQVISYFSSQAGEAQTPEEAVEAAAEGGLTADQVIAQVEKTLKAAGYEAMKLISREQEDDALILKYAHHQDDILYYPDRVDIKVSLQDGEILALNAREFWMNHHERTQPETMGTPEEALALLGEGAQAESSMLAYISNGAGGETLCHEIKHTIGEEQYLTYIGAEEMMEEQVMRSYTSDDGSFYSR